MTNIKIAKPFLKWAGGKTQLIKDIERTLPTKITKEKFTFIEPFVGSGAVLFWMLNNFPKLEKAVIYMRAGWFIRLSILVLIFILSIRISTAMFWAAVAGLVWVNVVVLINAVIYAYQKKMHENK